MKGVGRGREGRGEGKEGSGKSMNRVIPSEERGYSENFNPTKNIISPQISTKPLCV